MNTNQTITIHPDRVEWENFPTNTNDAIEQHLDAHPPVSCVWGFITKDDGTAGLLCDLTTADTLGVVQVLHDIMNGEAWEQT